jgi:hypothetical protein
MLLTTCIRRPGPIHVLCPWSMGHHVIGFWLGNGYVAYFNWRQCLTFEVLYATLVTQWRQICRSKYFVVIHDYFLRHFRETLSSLANGGKKTVCSFRHTGINTSSRYSCIAGYCDAMINDTRVIGVLNLTCYG